ncbi:MAG: hypothetical protein HRF49_11820 [bacterium]|jgi:hypothetical protein
MIEHENETHLHYVAGLVFARFNQSGDPATAGKAYADFFHKFKQEFDRESDRLRDEESQYRYSGILSESSSARQQQAAEPRQTPPSPKSDEDMSKGRTF